MYSLKKWYFDFLTPQRDYVFIYFADVRLAFITLRSLTVHLARPSQGVLLTRCITIPSGRLRGADADIQRLSGGRISCDRAEWVIAFSDEHCSVQLHYEPGEPESEARPVIIPTGTKSSIIWRPLASKRRVSGYVCVDNRRVEVERDNGYIDYLESSCLPPLVPVRSLHWGRVSSQDLDVVFMHAASTRKAHVWSALYGHANGCSFLSDRVTIEPLPAANGFAEMPAGDGGYSLHATTPAGTARVDIQHRAVVQQGSFIDQQEHTSRMTRWLLKLISRNPRGTKFLSSADVHLDFQGIPARKRDVAMIDECVVL